MSSLKKVLVITYYWPPSGGSGVQRWMFFCKYLPAFGIKPYVVTVKEEKASYKFNDNSFIENIKDTEVYKTNTLEPLKIYSKILGGDDHSNIPLGFSGEVRPSIFQKISRFIRGNFFIPDARVGWNIFAYKEAKKVIQKNKIDIVITTGPPHSSHLIGLRLKKNLKVKWIADFRDPWTEIYYNKLLYRSSFSKQKDAKLERMTIENADIVLTIGPSMKNLLQEKTVKQKEKFYYIYNGYESDLFKSIEGKKTTKDKFIICHIGIVSDSQPITSLLTALSLAYNNNKQIAGLLKLQFVGKVSPEIIKEIKEINPWLSLELIDYLPHKKAIEYMVNANLLFNSLAEMDNSKFLVSGKLMEYIATGNPVICLGDPNGDAAFLLKEFEDAEVFDRKNIDGIFKFIINIFNKWKINTNFKLNTNLKYSRFETTKQLSELINQLK